MSAVLAIPEVRVSPALYVYGLTLAQVSAPDLAQMIGVGGGNIELRPLGNFSAIVEPIHPEDFGRDVTEHQHDPPWLLERTTRHDAVLRAYLGGGVLPLRFGTVVSQVSALLGWLERSPQLVSQLERLRGAAEWTLRLWIAESALIEPSDPQLTDFDQRIAAASPGKRYLLERQRELHVAGRVPELARAQRGIWQSKIAELVQQVTLIDRLPQTRAGLVALLEVVVLAGADWNWAAQMPWATSGVHVEVSGPYAPYHFVGEELSP